MRVVQLEQELLEKELNDAYEELFRCQEVQEPHLKVGAVLRKACAVCITPAETEIARVITLMGGPCELPKGVMA